MFFVEANESTIPTMGFSNAEFKLLNFKVTAYDVGGGPRIRGIWKDYYAEVVNIKKYLNFRILSQLMMDS